MNMRSLVPFGWGGSLLPNRANDDDPFVRLRHEVDRLFDDFFQGNGVTERWSSGTIGLPVEIAETGTEFKVVAELPGVEEKDVAVELVGDMLTIKGEKKTEAEHKEESYPLAERRYGVFSRTLRLPFTAEAEKVEATFKNGVLTVTVPKPAELQQQPKRIEVKAAA
jgi:HSP20 family protein